MKKSGNQLAVATAVVGGLLGMATDAVAQQTYGGQTATTVSGTSSGTVDSSGTISTPLANSSGQTAPLSTVPVTNATVTVSSTAVTVVPTVTTTTPVTLVSTTTNPLPVTVAPTTGVTVPVTGSSPVTVTVGSTSNTGTVVTTGTLSAPSVSVSAGTFSTGTATSPGTVQITGSSGLTVSSGAVLRGSGTIVGSGGATIRVSGILRPGNSPGVLTVQNTPITLTGGSTLGIDIDGTTAGNGAGYYSQVKGTGSSTFAANGLLTPSLGSDVSYASGEAGSTGYKNPKIGTGYTIVTTEAANGVSGAFTGLGTTNGARTLGSGTSAAMLSNTTFDVVYNSNSIVLYVTPSRYQNLGQSGISLSTNQTNAATALQDLRMANKPLGIERIANSDLKSLFDNLAPQSAGSLQSIYDQVSGASVASLGKQAVQTANIVTDAFTSRASHERIVAQTGVSGGGAGLSGGDVDSKSQGDRGWAAWVQPIGQLGDIDADGNGPGYSHSTAGVISGLEGRFNNAVIGFGYGYARDSLDFNSFGNTADVDNHILHAYGEYAFGRAFVNGTVGYTWKDIEEKRNISIGNYNKTAKGETDGGNFTVAANVGYTFTPQSFIIEPSAGLRYNNFTLTGFTESGADSLNLRVNDQSYDSLQSVLSVRVARPFTTGGGVKLVPEVRLGWQHELLDSRSSVISTFTSGASRFTSTGAQVGEDAAVLGLGLKAQMTGRLDVFTDYTGRVGSKQTDHGLTAGLKYKF